MPYSFLNCFILAGLKFVPPAKGGGMEINMSKIKDIVSKMTLEDKVKLCSGADFWGTEEMEQYGIPKMFCSDGPSGLRRQLGEADHLGVNNSEPATCFPAACTSGSTWNTKLLEAVGRAIGEEALGLQTDVVLGPGVNIKRNPLCGRNFEYFSEDPYLAGKMGTAWVKGCEGTGRGASVKHFAGNNQEADRLLSDSLIDERTLREIYLKPFEMVVKEGKPATVMCSYNKINGTYLSDHVEITRNILRDEWGFDGVVVTDWGAMNDRVQGFEAGVELEMPGSAGFFDQSVIDAVKAGTLKEDRINECVERLLTLIFAKVETRKNGYRFDAEAHHDLARKVSEEGAVLLKNDEKILPVSKDTKVALLGAMAKDSRYQGAGSSHINPTKLVSIAGAFDAEGIAYSYAPGYEPGGAENKAYLEEAAELAEQCDTAVIVAGLPPEFESEGYDRKHMCMPKGHIQLIERVAKANPNVVVVLCGGSPVEMPWIGKVKAVLHMYLGGQAVGEACVNLLYGKINPSGKLTETYPVSYQDVTSSNTYGVHPRQAEYAEGIYVGYRYYQKASVKVRFPFGYGLSYTEFEYSSLEKENDTVSCTVKNVGDCDGAEVVQLYVADKTGHAYRSVRELKAFQKVFLKAGEEKRITFDLTADMYLYYDTKKKGWAQVKGSYEIQIGASSEDIRLVCPVILTEGEDAEAVNASEGLPQWYAAPQGKPSAADFEKLYGREIQPYHEPKAGEFTMMSTLEDMKGSAADALRHPSVGRRSGRGRSEPGSPVFNRDHICNTASQACTAERRRYGS